MKIRLLTCAQTSIVDQSSQNISIINIIDFVQTPIFPAAIPINLVAYFVKQPSEPDEVKIALIAKLDDQVLVERAFSVRFSGDDTTRLLASVGPALVTQPGVFRVEIRYKGKLLGDWPIRIQKAGNETTLLTGPRMASNLPDHRESARRVLRRGAKKVTSKRAAKKRA